VATVESLHRLGGRIVSAWHTASHPSAASIVTPTASAVALSYYEYLPDDDDQADDGKKTTAG
jgi:hypothetical protein